MLIWDQSKKIFASSSSFSTSTSEGTSDSTVGASAVSRNTFANAYHKNNARKPLIQQNRIHPLHKYTTLPKRGEQDQNHPEHEHEHEHIRVERIKKHTHSQRNHRMNYYEFNNHSDVEPLLRIDSTPKHETHNPNENKTELYLDIPQPKQEQQTSSIIDDQQKSVTSTQQAIKRRLMTPNEEQTINQSIDKGR
ncbi:MAG: hypothetical protein EZS28_030497, partial [Streblomastix strix]